MRQFEYVVTEPVGIHARPASMLVKAAMAYTSNITVKKDGKKADVKRLMALMALGVKCNEKVLFSIEGEDEEAAAKELEAYCIENL
ncbi:HPr family phosphocarrier protein [Vallitalea maricola]|uniref:HPr family phosphocarrier protein n=1 Tax=Vallitalea maricola TaxID=3074433 RepID=A0ACB5UGX3_9FIRM|nr:HPr family phosphocarrier protein [Vallitalea sp. AN17-2]